MKLVNDLQVKCNNCSKNFTYPKDEVEFELTCVDERNMGNENNFEATVEMTCESCKSEMRFVLKAWEYPEGAVNYENHDDCSGCTFLNTPHVELEPEFEP